MDKTSSKVHHQQQYHQLHHHHAHQHQHQHPQYYHNSLLSSSTSCNSLEGYSTNSPQGCHHAVQNKRKEKARIAARARRSQEASIIMEMANELHITQEKIRRIDKATIVKLAIDYIKAFEILCRFCSNCRYSPNNNNIIPTTPVMNYHNLRYSAPLKQVNFISNKEESPNSYSTRTCNRNSSSRYDMNELSRNSRDLDLCSDSIISNNRHSVKPASIYITPTLINNNNIQLPTPTISSATTTTTTTVTTCSAYNYNPNLQPITLEAAMTTKTTTTRQQQLSEDEQVLNQEQEREMKHNAKIIEHKVEETCNSNINENLDTSVDKIPLLDLTYPAPKLSTKSIFAPKTEDIDSHFLMINERDGKSSFVLKADDEILDEDDLTHLAPQAGDMSIPLEAEPLDGIILDTELFLGSGSFSTSSPNFLTSNNIKRSAKELLLADTCYISYGVD